MVLKWLPGGVTLPLPDDGQQITWGSNVQQLGRGASKLILDGSTATVTASQMLVRHSSGGQIQTLAAVDGGIAEIQFNRKPTGVSSAGDLWALGHRSFSGQDGFFSIGCNLTNVTLSISPSGTVNVPYSLTIGGVAVQRIPYVSCRVSGNIVSNSRGQITPTSTASSGLITVIMSPAHPAGATFTPQATLIGNRGEIYIDPPTSGGSVSIYTFNTDGAQSTLEFCITIF